MERVRVFASGGDKKAKGVSNWYGHALYAGMEGACKKVIESELQLSTIVLGPFDDYVERLYQEPKNIVEKILRKVA